jgi:kinesin family protein 3/17
MHAQSDAKECVKVVVRCRPLNQKEKTEKHGIILDVDEKNATVSIRDPDSPNEPPKVFTFDATFSSDAAQIQIYKRAVQQIVEAVLDGYNGTIFAYGTLVVVNGYQNQIN